MSGDRFKERPPLFFRPPPSCQPIRGRMPWGSPRPPCLRPSFYMTPEGLRLPTNMQPPPMFGPRGATLPPHLLSRDRDRGAGPSQHWCDSCDRGFPSEEMLNRHNKEHQKCGIDGCTFTAHMNIVSKHIQMQHSSGLYKKICKTDTPEDVQKWINERKKNYPSRENIQMKLAQEKECMDRGERLTDDKSRFNKNNNSRFSKNRSFNRHHSRNDSSRSYQQRRTRNSHENDQRNKMSDRRQKNYEKKIDLAKSIPEDESRCNLKPFKGTSQLYREDVSSEIPVVVNDNLDIEDNEWKDEKLVNENGDGNKAPTVCSALSNLISAYDSSDDEEPVETKIIKETKDMNVELEKKNDVASEKIDRKEKPKNVTDCKENGDSSGPEEVKIDKVTKETDLVEDCKKESVRKRTRKRGNSNKNDDESSGTKKTCPSTSKYSGHNNKNVQRQNLKRRLPKTLLEKLLEKDVRHERNVILQCVRHVVKNDFFDKKEEK